MFCHRTGPHRPDGELIGRFQKLCGESFFNEGSNNKLEPGNPFIAEGDNKMTPSEGVCKKVKVKLQLSDPSFSFDGNAPSNSSTSTMSEQRMTPQSQNLDIYTSQLKASTTFHDLVEGYQPSKNISPQNNPKLPFRDQFEDQANSNSLDGINPAVTWNSMDPFSTQDAYAPNQFPQPSLDWGSMALPAEPRNFNHIPENELSWDSTEKAQPVGHNVRHSQKKSYPEGNQYRYPATLLAPTAMVNDSSETAVSYLNKGQVYHLKVVDPTPSAVHTSESTQYRTFVRISFDKEQQRSDPAAYWEIWKSARGLHKSNEKLKAVEYVGENNTSMLVEQVSLDGFSVTWTGNPADRMPQCSIPVRFNFLSTDFTLSKGVKGMQVRLCAKTKQLGEVDTQEPEVYFCNVKLFRDHGAERKLSNDATSIRKRIEKLHLLMNDPAPPECSNKRKRGSVSAKSNPDLSYSKNNLQRQGDLSIDLDNAPQQAKFHQQLQKRLDALERCFYSSRPESALNLCAGPQDDPELHPTVPLNADDPQKPAIMSRRDSSIDDASSATSDLAGFNERETPSSTSSLHDVGKHTVSPTSLKLENLPTMPAACFYIRIVINDQSPSEYYRAIYPKSRTFQDLKLKILEKSSAKTSLDVSSILHLNETGLKIEVDDEFVHEMAEGQSMTARIVETPGPCLDASNVSGNKAQHEIWLEY